MSPLDRLDVFVPPSIRAGERESLHKARLLVRFCGTLAGVSATIAAVMAAQGALLTALSCLAFGFIYLLPLAAVWLTGRLWLGGLGLGVVTGSAIAGNAAVQDGVRGVVLYWFCLMIVSSLLWSGRRGGLAMLAFASLTTIGLGLLEGAGLPPPSLGVEVSVVALVLSLLVLFTGIYGLGSLFESANERMRQVVEEQNAQLRTLLENIGQGFCSVDQRGGLHGSHSAVMERWFGVPAPGQPLWSWLGAADPAFGSWLSLGWDALADDILPLELTLTQLPSQLARDGRTWRVEYRPVLSQGSFERMILVVTDVTDLLASERAAAAQRDLAVALDRALQDPHGFSQFLAEASAQMSSLSTSPGSLRRHLHTLKGNCAMFGLSLLSEQIHALEAQLEDAGCLPPEEIAVLQGRWAGLRERLGRVLGNQPLALDPVRHQQLREAVQTCTPYPTLGTLVDALAFEPASRPLGRAADHARSLAQRLGKGELVVQIRAEQVWMDPERFGSFWSSLVHVVRNAVDHGIELPEVREAAGKPSAGTLRLSAQARRGEALVEVADDGAGVDWSRVAQRAQELGLPHETREDLVEAMFAPGLSTRADVTDISGRGVGMDAFRSAVRALGGALELDSERGRGTRIRIQLPMGQAAPACKAPLPEEA